MTLKELIQQEQGKFDEKYTAFEISSCVSKQEGKNFKSFLAEAMTTTAKAVGELVPEEASERNVIDVTGSYEVRTYLEKTAWNACRETCLSAFKTFLGEEI